MKNTGKEKAARKRGWLKEYLRSAQALRLLICILGAAVLMTIFEVAIVPVRYNLRVGMVPTNTIAATKDVVDEWSTEQKRAAAAAQVTPTFRFQEGVTETVLADLDQIFAQLRAVRQYGAMLPDQSSSRVYNKEELQYARDMLTLITLRDYQITTLLHSTQSELDNAYSLLYSALQSIMQGYVIEGQESTAVASIRQIVDYRISIPIGQNIVPAVLNACIQPNMLVDQEATDAARQEARNAVEPVIYKQGQNIVVRGEGRITASQLAMLSTLGLLRDSKVDLPMYLGAALMMVLVLSGTMLLLSRKEYHLFDDTARLLLLFVILIICLGLCVIARLVNAYLAPTVLCVMLVTVLLGMRPGLICNVALTVLVSALTAGGSEAYTEKMVMLLTTGVLSGTAAAIVLKRRNTRVRVLFAGLTACLVDFLTILALGLMTASELSGSLITAAWRSGGSAIATLLCIGLQSPLEMAFNLPTPMKLMELSNPNQPLLRRLLLEAPGTYHHSTIVASLAEAAAEAIGANPLLARVGGYYHDIGKLKRPLYFKENQLGDVNIHDQTDPHVSAAIVTSHTRDGLALARQYRLPQEIQHIIVEHHGDTPVMFFYHKALQLAKGKPVDMASFRYDGRPPQTQEGAIILLCDTIEAAVRTMKNPTPDSIEEFIVKLVRGKLEDGQLSDSPLTLRDIDKICTAATTVLCGVFHERIEYPDMDETRPSAPVSPVELAVPETDREEKMEIPDAAPGQAEKPDTDLDILVREPVPTVAPLAPEKLVAVAPPPAAKLVPIDHMIYFEPLPTKDQAEAEQKTEEKAETPAQENGEDS